MSIEDPKACSEMIGGQLMLQIKCVHCDTINYLSQGYSPDMDDASAHDMEALTCWNCEKDSFIDKSLLDVYPEGLDQQLNIEVGQQSPKWDEPMKKQSNWSPPVVPGYGREG